MSSDRLTLPTPRGTPAGPSSSGLDHRHPAARSSRPGSHLLRNKAERDRSPVPSETLEFIASRITSNIRELEGALIRVTAYASLNHVPISSTWPSSCSVT
ncbi:MAG: DnaA/Hda family protein [Ilumatobacteraceae bacterium]